VPVKSDGIPGRGARTRSPRRAHASDDRFVARRQALVDPIAAFQVDSSNVTTGFKSGRSSLPTVVPGSLLLYLSFAHGVGSSGIRLILSVHFDTNKPLVAYEVSTCFLH
jgi:hypothetical protein